MSPDDPLSVPPDTISRRSFLERSALLGAGLSVARTGALPVAESLERTAATPLAASYSYREGRITLSNAEIRASWSLNGGTFMAQRIDDRLSGVTFTPAPGVFTLLLDDGGHLGAESMRIVAGPRAERLVAHAGSSRLVERSGGWQVSVTLRDADERIEATWRGVLRDGSRYVRQEVTFSALREPLAVREIVLVDTTMPHAAVVGTVKGSPVVAGGAYAAFEHPLSTSTVEGDRVRCSLTRELPLRPGALFAVSAVAGVTRPGQLRRDFLGYIERERAHPYRTFLHYNSWYDIGYFSKYDEADALAVIAAYGTELQQRRKVVLSSFLFDDGWDDAASLWGFHSGFPQGFARVRDATARYGAAPGVWMSPWGGYGDPKKARIASGSAQGFETNEGGFQLSGPKYYQRFRDTCLDMIRRYGVNQFKIDGTGNAASAFPGSVFDSDFDAAIALIGELRAEEPDLFVNLTTGTYPSPFWLRYSDTIWRGGEDHEFAGVGSMRQRWITYRDADTYAGIVQSGPLYPLNSLMLHGMIYAKHAHCLDSDPENDFRDEARSYFGTGTQLQEMYITPSLLSDANWDTIAECARWSRAHAGTLVDSHWVGGDPGKLEAYGWAAWSPSGATLTLRNPADEPRKIAIDAGTAFELPEDAPRSYTLRSPWRSDVEQPSVRLRAGAPHEFTLAPFQVLTLATATRSP